MSGSERRIAVIAVHGVADQRPGETAQAVAELLAAEPHASAPIAETVLIPLEPLPRTYPGVDQGPADPGTAFADKFLNQRPSDDREAFYAAQRLRLHVPASATGPARDVDVYEMYWADLSRLAPGAWRILSELYQIIFHLGSVGEKVLSSARHANRGNRWLATAHIVTKVSLFVLSYPILALNLALLAAFLVASPAFIPEGAHRPLAVGLGCFTFFLGIAALTFGFGRRRLVWLQLGGCVAALAAAGMLFAVWRGLLSHTQILLLLFGGAIFATLAYVVSRFCQLRPELRHVGYGFYAAGVSLIVWRCLTMFAQQRGDGWAPCIVLDREAIVIGAMQASEFIMLLLAICWVARLTLDIVFAALAGKLVWSPGMSDPTERARTRTAVKTATLGTVVSSAGFMLLTISFWSGLQILAARAIGDDPILYSAPMLIWPPAETVTLMGDYFLKRSAMLYGATAFTFLMIGAVLLFAIGPSLLVEIAPRLGERQKTPDANPFISASRLGSWLSTRLDGLAILIAVAMGFAAVLSVIYLSEYAIKLLCLMGAPGCGLQAGLARLENILIGLSNDYLRVIGSLIAGTAVTLIALGNRLSDSLGKVRVVIDILLDVDNYLREHPSGANPRAKIHARYEGLLKHIAAAPSRYDAVVIVAHSQGTVITADLLRLQTHHGRLPRGVDWRFLSLGCPLRQLYAAHFPHWYGWIKQEDAGQLLRRAGLSTWINIYGAGDYVGRQLFKPNETTTHALSESGDVAAGVRNGGAHDFCGGALAHMHYLDNSMPAVRDALWALTR